LTLATSVETKVETCILQKPPSTSSAEAKAKLITQSRPWTPQGIEKKIE